jgi:hypothetical protein
MICGELWATTMQDELSTTSQKSEEEIASVVVDVWRIPGKVDVIIASSS